MQVPGDARVPSAVWTRLPSTSLASKKGIGIGKTCNLTYFNAGTSGEFQGCMMVLSDRCTGIEVPAWPMLVNVRDLAYVIAAVGGP
jgi:hypothetical protein